MCSKLGIITQIFEPQRLLNAIIKDSLVCEAFVVTTDRPL